MNRPKITDKAILAYVEELEDKLKSPYYSSYLTCKTTIDRWNKQLLNTEIDILNTESKPLFEMAHKFLTEQKPYLEQLEYLLKLMSHEEVVKAKKLVTKDEGVEEYLKGNM